LSINHWCKIPVLCINHCRYLVPGMKSTVFYTFFCICSEKILYLYHCKLFGNVPILSLYCIFHIINQRLNIYHYLFDKCFFFFNRCLNFLKWIMTTLIGKRSPYPDDLVYAPWHASCLDVHRGPDDGSSSKENKIRGQASLTLPETCVCQHCRLGHIKDR